MKFGDVVGLDNLKSKLTRSIVNDKLPHAQLFLGPEGSGKLPMALAVTQYIYCTDKKENDSCGECSSCRKVSSLTHPDVHFSFPTVGSKEISNTFLNQWREINALGPYFNTEDWVAHIAKDENKSPNITREETKSIISKLSLKPYEGDAKTLIIWMPEYLAAQSNALLKLIEEPPQKTYFILVAENSDALLATITSRTQLVKIPSYSEQETQEFLQQKYTLDPQKSE
ncbi:MAG: ATP-binding protein, partial [Bacteroidia bacterium]